MISLHKILYDEIDFENQRKAQQKIFMASRYRCRQRSNVPNPVNKFIITTISLPKYVQFFNNNYAELGLRWKKYICDWEENEPAHL